MVLAWLKKTHKDARTPESDLGQRIDDTLFLAPVCTVEFDNIVNTLRNCAPGHDELNANILKLSLPYTKQHLVHLLNQSLAYGIFSTELKIAKVVPLFKADDPMKFNNYRPASLLNILSKIFEKAMYSRLIDFLETQNILTQQHFAARKQHSTYKTLMILVDKLTKALENGDYVLGELCGPQHINF